jgi:hypothetical protein
MSKSSEKQFLGNYSSFPNFHKKLLKQANIDWSILIEHPQDYYAANSGAIPGMIYYTDTVTFAKNNHLSILQILDEFESDCGELENKLSPQDETQYFNWLSWFAWESMMREVLSFVGSES